MTPDFPSLFPIEWSSSQQITVVLLNLEYLKILEDPHLSYEMRFSQIVSDSRTENFLWRLTLTLYIRLKGFELMAQHIQFQFAIRDILGWEQGG